MSPPAQRVSGSRSVTGAETTARRHSLAEVFGSAARCRSLRSAGSPAPDLACGSQPSVGPEDRARACVPRHRAVLEILAPAAAGWYQVARGIPEGTPSPSPGRPGGADRCRDRMRSPCRAPIQRARWYVLPAAMPDQLAELLSHRLTEQRSFPTRGVVGGSDRTDHRMRTRSRRGVDPAALEQLGNCASRGRVLVGHRVARGARFASQTVVVRNSQFSWVGSATSADQRR